MKRTLCSLGAFIALTFCASAQTTDTINSFFTGTPTIYGTQGGGYISGNNAYGDLAKMQLFDVDHGVNGVGTITEVLVGILAKTDAGGNFKVAIWADNNGQPASTTLATKTINISDVDTNVNSFGSIGNGFYNVSAKFTTPVSIPSSQKFWVGVILPTTAGDTIGLLSNTDKDFPDANMYTGEFQSDGSFHFFNDGTNATWQTDVALAVFPIAKYTSLNGISELEKLGISLFPNPFKNELFIQSNQKIESISVRSLDGKEIINETINMNKINTSALASGTYIIQLTTDSKQIISQKLIKE